MASAYDRTPPPTVPREAAGRMPAHPYRPEPTDRLPRTGPSGPAFGIPSFAGFPMRAASGGKCRRIPRCGRPPAAGVAGYPIRSLPARRPAYDPKKTGPPLSTILLRHSFRCRPNICLEDAPSRSGAFRSLLWPQRHARIRLIRVMLPPHSDIRRSTNRLSPAVSAVRIVRQMPAPLLPSSAAAAQTHRRQTAACPISRPCRNTRRTRGVV